MNGRMRTMIALGLAGATLGLAACGGGEGSGGHEGVAVTASTSNLPQGSEPANLEPDEFTTEIDNPYWPMSPGSKWVYSETDTKGNVEDVVVEVTDETKTIANGVEARVIRDTVSEHGVPV